MRRVVLAALLGLGACSDEPRSTSFFLENEVERASVLKNCESGTERGAECPNAKQAEFTARQKNKRRAAEDAREAYVNRSRDRH